MKLIATGSALAGHFRRMIHDYKNLQWATAWAGVGSEPFAALLRSQQKIRRLVVGSCLSSGGKV